MLCVHSIYRLQAPVPGCRVCDHGVLGPTKSSHGPSDQVIQGEYARSKWWFLDLWNLHGCLTMKCVLFRIRSVPRRWVTWTPERTKPSKTLVTCQRNRLLTSTNWTSISSDVVGLIQEDKVRVVSSGQEVKSSVLVLRRNEMIPCLFSNTFFCANSAL